MKKIGFITSYSRMEADFKDLAQSEGCELIFRVGVMEYAIDIAIEMEKELHVDAIIATEITGDIIKKHVAVPVIPLRIKDYNLVDAFYRARQFGENIAFADISHQTTSYNFNRIATILGYKIRRYKFDHPDEAASLVNTVVADRQNVIVSTASCTLSLARKENLPTILIEPLRHDLVETIHIAKNIIAVKKKEIEKYNWLNAIIDNINEGIITVDRNGIITSINSFIQYILKIQKDDIVGKNIDYLITHIPLIKKSSQTADDFELIKYNNREFVVSRTEIYTDRLCLGSVYKIEALQSIQHIEMEARKKSVKSGFIATSTFTDIIGNSAAITETKQKAQRFALADCNIIINGESGSGKEIFAQSIHNHSYCKNGPFVAINCATLPEQLLDSELFGFEEGAFTGAKKGGKAGLFEMAHNGTLFLDEIAEMPPLLQAKLLRVLQEKVVRRVGGSKNIPINVRVVFATNKDLFAEVKNNAFREDLYYRINVLNLKIPPLRERKEDIPCIAMHIIQKVGNRRAENAALSEAMLASLALHDWRGNVRELYSFIERVIALTGNKTYDVALADAMIREILTGAGQNAQEAQGATGNGEKITLPVDTMKNMQNAIIQHMYGQFKGDKKKVEIALEMSNTTLWRRFKDLGL